MGVGGFLYFGGFDYLAGHMDSPVLALAGGVGGLITGLVLRRTKPPTPWKQISVATVGWVIGALVLSWGANSDLDLVQSIMVLFAIFGLVGGLITSLGLKWTHPFIQWKSAAIAILGWGIGWAIGGAVGDEVMYTMTTGYMTMDYDVERAAMFALAGGIGGAVGSWVTFSQFRQARQSST
jgi:hypothetical protein